MSLTLMVLKGLCYKLTMISSPEKKLSTMDFSPKFIKNTAKNTNKKIIAIANMIFKYLSFFFISD